jgi:hypothetical protein
LHASSASTIAGPAPVGSITNASFGRIVSGGAAATATTCVAGSTARTASTAAASRRDDRRRRVPLQGRDRRGAQVRFVAGHRNLREARATCPSRPAASGRSAARSEQGGGEAITNVRADGIDGDDAAVRRSGASVTRASIPRSTRRTARRLVRPAAGSVAARA